MTASSHFSKKVKCVHSTADPRHRGHVMNHDIILHGGHAERQTMSKFIVPAFFYYLKTLEIMPEKKL